jgi:hypothetical protein
MAKTSRIGLNVVPATEDTKKFKEWRTELAGDGDDSNMVILDSEIAKLQDRVIFSPTQPVGQITGDTWNEELV